MKPRDTGRFQFRIIVVISFFLTLIAACIPGNEVGTDPTKLNNNLIISGQIVLADKKVSPLLPKGSKIIVQVLENSLADASVKILGEEAIPDAKSLPVNFQITVIQADFNNAFQPYLSARIEDTEGLLLFTNDTKPLILAEKLRIDIPMVTAVKDIKTPTMTMETPPPQATSDPGGMSTLLENSDLWRGIGRINLISTCTAALVDTGAGVNTPAYIFTNGHCVEWLANGAIINRKAEGEVVFNYFADTLDSQIAIPINQIVYSTMQGIDIAIIRLDASLAELAEQNIFPLPIAEAPLPIESQVRVVGAPSSGLDSGKAYLRQEVCQAYDRVDLLEFSWHFYDHYATTCKDIFGGSSGSPLLSTESNTIYGLINTTVEGSSACYLGVPCEITAGKVTVNEDTSYATPVDGLGACFSKDGLFSLSADCPLPPASQLAFEGFSHSVSQPPLIWDVTLAGDLPYYRYKAGAAGLVNCRSNEGYSQPISLAKNSTITDAVPDEEGFYLLCVLAGNSALVNNSWQSFVYPTVAIAQIDTTPPQLEPQLDIFKSPDFIDISLVFFPPELSDYRYKFGPKDLISCANNDGYLQYRRIPITIERSEGPSRLCVIGFDNANNATQPLDTVFED